VSGFEFDCTLVRETDSAILVLDHASEAEVWIPRSAVVSLDVDGETKVGTIEVEEWVAAKKGLL